MKKLITLLFLISIGYTGFTQTICTQTFSESGQDADPTILTINAADVTCNGGETINSITLKNSAGNLDDFLCGSWYDFTLNVDGTDIVTGCAADINNTDVTGFSTITITSANLDAFTDNITIEVDLEVDHETPSCPSPSNLNVSNISTTSVDLEWASETTASTGYDYFLTSNSTVPDGTTTPTGSVGSGSGTITANLTGLMANTDYDAYVRTDCGGGDVSAWSSAVSFKTFGDCSSTGSFDYVNNSDSSNSVGFKANTPGDFITIEFTAGGTESCCDDWFIKDAADGSGNTIATGSGSIVGSYESTTGVISFYVDSDGSVQGTTFQYELSCAPPPSCITPANLAVSNITTTTAGLEWASETTASNGYDYFVTSNSTVPDGTTTPTGSVGSGSGTITANLTSLMSNTDYDAYVRSDCGSGDVSDWSSVVNFTTDCAAFTTPYSENFDGAPDADPFAGIDCWATAGNNANEVELEDFGFWSSTPSSPNLVEFGDVDLDDGEEAILVSPQFSDLSDADNRIRFKAAFEDASGNTSELIIGVMSDPANATTFVELERVTSNTDDVFNSYTVDLDNGASIGTAEYVAIASGADSGGFDEIAFDDFVYEEIPSCFAPSNLTTSNITTTDVDLDWVASPSTVNNGYDWEIVLAGNGQGNGAVASGNTADTFVTANGLSANTEYDAYVRANCSDGDQSSYIGPVSFTTDCAAFTAPYSENFDGAPTADPFAGIDCWTTAGNNANEVELEDDSPFWINAAPSSPNLVEFGDVDLDDGDEAILVSPQFSDLQDADNRIRFKAAFEDASANTSELIIGVMADQNDASTFVELERVTSNTDDVFNSYTIDLDNAASIGSNQYIAIASGADGGSFDEIAFDDFVYEEIPSCELPSNLQATNVTNTGVDLGWVAASPAPANGYDWEIVPAGDGQGNNVVASGSTPAGDTDAIASGLSASTGYDAYVRSDCGGGDNSPWSSAVSFNTLPANDDACNATALTIDATSAGDAFTNVNATEQMNEPDNQLNGGVNSSVWFTFVAPAYGNVQVTTDIAGGSLTDTEIAVYSVGDCNDFTTYTQIGFDQDDGITVGLSSVLNLYDLNMGETYYVQVDRWNTASDGTFGIEVLDLSYVYNGTAWSPQVPGGNATDINNLIIESGTAPIAAATTANEVMVQAGAALDLNADLTGDVTFKSDNTGTAQLADATGNSITGDVTVERFIPVQTQDTRAFRFLTSAVDSNGSIFDNWQESGNSPAGFGTHITGNNDGTNGVDQTITGNPSMYTFDNTSADGDGNQGNDWEAVTDTKGNNLVAGEAYRIFIRGDRNYDLDSSGPDAPNSDVTLRATGNLVIGSHIHTLSDVANYYSLIGNPYQAVVDFNNLTTTNVKTSSYSVWDPNMSARGAYVTHNLTTGSNTVVSSATNEFIMPGQSFFVQTNTNAAASLEFTEASKNVTATQTAVFSDDTDPSYMNLLLYKDQDLSNGGTESDGILMIFSQNGNDAVDQMDAGKLGNPDENLARSINGDYLSVDDRSLPSDMENLELFTAGYSVTDYTFSLNANNLSDDVDVYLIDNHTGDQTLMNGNSNQYSFTVDSSIPGSVAADRFSIQFEIETFGIDDNELADSFTVYPNPVTDGQLTITSSQMAGDDVELNLYNMIGQSVLQTEGTFESNGEMKLNLGSYQAGVYFIEVSNNGETAKERLIIK